MPRKTLAKKVAKKATKRAAGGSTRSATHDEGIRYRRVETPLVSVLFAFTSRGLCFVTLTGELEQLEAWRDRHEPGAEIVEDRRLEPAFAKAVRAAGKGGNVQFDVRLDERGTDFQRKVWNELRRIPHGRTRTYAEIAERIGQPNACRAVGSANGRNPMPLVTPCHRVVGAQGLGGFTFGGQLGGLDVKRALLEAEAADSGE